MTTSRPPEPPEPPGPPGPPEPTEPTTATGSEPRITTRMPPPLTPLRNPWVEQGMSTPEVTNGDAASMGLDARTVEGAQVAFFSRLDGAKRSHRLVAWVVIAVMFVLPALLALLQLVRGG